MISITEAIVLAGGKGTRLQSQLNGEQKCLAPVNGRPFLHYVLSHLQAQGITRVIFALGYDAESVRDYADLNWPSLEKDYALEKTALGTGGAIKNALTRAETENLLIVNGDTLFRFKLRQAEALHFRSGADCTILLKPLTNFKRFGVVTFDDNFRITGFVEKQPAKAGMINAGAYLINRFSFEAIQWPETFSFEKDFLEKYFTRLKIMGCPQDEYFIDIGVPEDYARAISDF